MPHHSDMALDIISKFSKYQLATNLIANSLQLKPFLLADQHISKLAH